MFFLHGSFIPQNMVKRVFYPWNMLFLEHGNTVPSSQMSRNGLRIVYLWVCGRKVNFLFSYILFVMNYCVDCRFVPFRKLSILLRIAREFQFYKAKLMKRDTESYLCTFQTTFCHSVSILLLLLTIICRLTFSATYLQVSKYIILSKFCTFASRSGLQLTQCIRPIYMFFRSFEKLFMFTLHE